MKFEFIPAAYAAQELTRKIMMASLNVENEWFFFDGTFNFSADIQTTVNTWLYENFVVVYDNDITAYFEGHWERPLDIINGFRCINFSKKHSKIFVEAVFRYFDYLFVNRGCKALNWIVAIENEHAMRQYDRFVKHYCGHRVGMRHHAQKSYTGKISDVCLFEVTQEDYLECKQRGNKKR